MAKLTQIDQIVLRELRKIPAGTGKEVSEIARKDPEVFVEAVKHMIDLGYTEYRFSNDYTSVHRDNLPDFASEYIRDLDHDNISIIIELEEGTGTGHMEQSVGGMEEHAGLVATKNELVQSVRTRLPGVERKGKPVQVVSQGNLFVNQLDKSA